MNAAANARRIRDLNERGALQAALAAERAHPVSSRTFGCGCVHTFAGPLGALICATQCDGHSPKIGIVVYRTPADSEREIAEIPARLRATTTSLFPSLTTHSRTDPSP